MCYIYTSCLYYSLYYYFFLFRPSRVSPFVDPLRIRSVFHSFSPKKIFTTLFAAAILLLSKKKGKRTALRWDLILDRDFCFCKSFWSIFKRDEMFDMSSHLISVSGIELKLTETSVHEELSLIFMSERWKIIIFRQIRMQIVYGADGDQQQSVFFLHFPHSHVWIVKFAV